MGHGENRHLALKMENCNEDQATSTRRLGTLAPGEKNRTMEARFREKKRADEKSGTRLAAAQKP
jgi:hypothetical protein